MIKLYNRDGADLRLEKLGSNIWELRTDDKHLYIFKYMRVISDDHGNIEAIDPSGGPFISVGDVFENKYEVTKILHPLKLEIHERNNN